MPFEVIPAVDVSEGRLCRMALGGPAVVAEFGGDPVLAAESYAAAGARWLHFVDVDLAFEGEARNLEVLRKIVRLGVAVQASGGIRSGSDVQRVLDAGAARAVLGSAALEDPEKVAGLAEELGARLVLGVETEGGRVRPRGRDRSIDLDLADTMAWLSGTSAVRFLQTNVRRVGELSGPDLEGLAVVLGAGRPVVAAGGMASQDDLHAVAAAGAEGAVVGRAALEGRLDLRALIAAMG